MNSSNIVRQGFKNVIYVVLAQFISYGLSFLTTFILPGVLGVAPYGYYQVYAFYTGYVGVLQFGFIDGIYLRYGGFDYKQLPAKTFRAYSRSLLLAVSAIALIFFAISLSEHNTSKKIAYLFACGNIIVINYSAMFNYINQITGRIKKYSFVVVAEKVQIILAIVILLFFQNINFKYVIIADFTAKVVVLIINIYNCRSIVFGKPLSIKKALPQCISNLNVGIKLMLANFMAMLVMGLGRFILERFGSVSDFGLYSFAVSSTNLAMMFITSVSMILYPILCRLDRNNLPHIFIVLNRLLCIVIYVMLLMYYPLVFAVQHWLTKYISILSYLYLLFPIVIMSSKIELLINTFYKSLREEKAMLKANFLSVFMFLLIAVPNYYFFRSVTVIVWATLITFVWRCYASEIFLKNKMGIKYLWNIFEEILVAGAFILATGYIRGIAGFCIYFAVITLYFIVNKKYIIKDVKNILNNLAKT